MGLHRASPGRTFILDRFVTYGEIAGGGTVGTAPGVYTFSFETTVGLQAAAMTTFFAPLEVDEGETGERGAPRARRVLVGAGHQPTLPGRGSLDGVASASRAGTGSAVHRTATAGWNAITGWRSPAWAGSIATMPVQARSGRA